MTVVLLYTGIDNLANFFKLKHLVNWQSLGLQLGLFHTTLQKIKMEKQCGKVDDCVMEMLLAWQEEQDYVIQCGGPSWSQLKVALIFIGENKLASNIMPVS